MNINKKLLISFAIATIIIFSFMLIHNYNVMTHHMNCTMSSNHMISHTHSQPNNNNMDMMEQMHNENNNQMMDNRTMKKCIEMLEMENISNIGEKTNIKSDNSKKSSDNMKEKEHNAHH